MSHLFLMLILPFSFGLVNDSRVKELHSIGIYQELFNRQNRYFNNTDMYLYEEISEINTNAVKRYLKNKDYDLSKKEWEQQKLILLNAGDFENARFHILKATEIENIKDTSDIAICEIRVGNIFFSESQDRALVAASWNLFGFGEQRIYSFERAREKWFVVATKLIAF